MCLLCRFGRIAARVGAVLAACQFVNSAEGAIRDGGIDPSNLGKGEWIYQMHHAIAQCNGNVPSVTDVPSLMIYLKNQGVRYIIVKAGTGAELFGVPGFNPQFTSSLVNQAHAAGLWIFGYNRSYATNTAGEVAIANYVFQQGADGFVWDAEAEWESSRIGSQGPALAIAQCSQVRSNWPNKFLAHAPFPIITYHPSFPYKEFGYYCDAVMPQDYWIEIGVTPTYMVSWMTSQWKTWQSGLSGQWVNAIKPIVPVGQAWSSTSGTVTAAQITEFFTALKNQANPATTGGYKGANFWVCEVQPPDVWDAIRTNSIGTVPTNNAPVIANVSVSGVNSSSATVTWTTDQSSDSVVEYGPDTSYGTSVTNSTLIYYHTVSLTNLSPYSTYHFRVKSKNAYNRTGVSADYIFTTTAATVPDVIVDDGNVAYAGSWTVGSYGTPYGTEYRFASTAAGGTATATFRPNITTAGNYDVYVWYLSGGNRANNAPYTVSYNGGSLAVNVNQTINGSTWYQIASARNFAAGTSGYARLSNNTGASGAVVIADAVKFVFVPPPPAGPSIVAQPQSLTVTQGNSATFSVSASGTPLLYYQWRLNGTNSMAGATGSIYTKSTVQAADGGSYSVVITNAYGTTNSQSATLTVLVPAEVVLSPTDVATGLGLDATFSAVATGTAPLSYQWQFNGTNLDGVTASTLTVTNVQADKAGAYAVVVSNLYGTDTSFSAFLTLLDPCIATQPQDQTLVLGADAVFSVSAVGTPTLSYRWCKEGAALFDGGRISGAGTPTITVANAQASDMGNYSVVVSNVNGQVASSNATLLGAYPPFIRTQPASRKVLADSTALLAVEVAGIGPFTFQWRRDGTNLTDGGKFNGATSASLIVSNVQVGESGDYSVVVSNAYGATTSSIALLGLWPLTAWGRNDYGEANIPGGLSNVTAVAGGLYHSLAARGNGTVAAWGAGWTNTGVGAQQGQAIVPDGLSNVVGVAGGYYHSLALTADGAIVAWGAGTTNTGASPHYGQAIVPSGLSNVMAIAAGGYHTLALTADGTVVAWGAGTDATHANPSYGQTMVPEGLSNVVAIAGGGYHSVALKADGTVAAWGAGTANTGSTPDYGQAMVPAGLNSVVAIAAGSYHSLALKADGTVEAWGAGTNNTGVSPNYGQAMVPAGLSNVVAIAPGRYQSLALRADGTLQAWGDSSYNLTSPPAGVANGIQLAGIGFHNLVLEGDGRPYITVQPFGQAVAAGTSVRLTALAVGAQPLSYQWRHNGANVGGGTDATLNLTDVQGPSAGSYSVVVTNSLGSATSAQAVLAVVGSAVPPHVESISLLPDGEIELQISGGPGSFAIECAPVLSGWTQLTSITATDAVFQYIDPDTNQTSRFYRVRLVH